jgi:hypothetical protein
MFRNDGGILVGGKTEKDNPIQKGKITRPQHELELTDHVLDQHRDKDPNIFRTP